MRHELLLVFALAIAQGGFAQTTQTFAPFVSQEAKNIYLEQHRNSPIERYDVCYFKADSGKDALTPAYVDLGKMTAYRWDGVY